MNRGREERETDKDEVGRQKERKREMEARRGTEMKGKKKQDSVCAHPLLARRAFRILHSSVLSH